MWTTPPPRPAEGEGRAHDERQPDLLDRRARVGHAVGDRAARNPQSGVGHGLAKALPVLGTVDRVVVGADQLDPVLGQRSVLVQGLGQVQCGLAAERGQQRIGLFALDHLRDRAREQRLDVGHGRDLGVGHDRGRIGVDQDDLVALLHQHPAGLGARIVELGRLADDDRPGSDQQDLVDVIAAGHYAAALISSTKRSNR